MQPSMRNQPQGGNPALAQLFRSNAPAAPGAMPSQMPQIMAPRTPNIGMPPRPQMPIQASAAPAVDPMRAFRQQAAERHMRASSTAGRIRDDPNGMPRWYGTGGRNAR